MATTLELLDIAIQQLAVDGIATVSIEGQSVTTKNLNELLEYRKLLLSQAAATRPGGGIRLQTITPVYQ